MTARVTQYNIRSVIQQSYHSFATQLLEILLTRIIIISACGDSLSIYRTIFHASFVATRCIHHLTTASFQVDEPPLRLGNH